MNIVALMGAVLAQSMQGDPPPPRSFRLSPENSRTAARIGIRFNGTPRPSDVVAYDVDGCWIETTRGKVLSGHVEPYWRHPISTAAAAEIDAEAAADAQERARCAAEAKRARRAAKALRDNR